MKREQLTEVLEWPGVVEAAREIDISINRAYHLVWTGKLLAQKISGQWHVSPSSIAAYAERRAARKALLAEEQTSIPAGAVEELRRRRGP
jgi:hypothetical protein